MAETKYPFWHPKRHPDLFGVVLAAFVISQCAALMTFHAQLPHHNILGLFGYFSAYGWLVLFGPDQHPGASRDRGLKLAGCCAMMLTTALPAIRSAALGVLGSLSMLTTLVAVLFPHVEALWTELVGAPPGTSMALSSRRRPRRPYLSHTPVSQLRAPLQHCGNGPFCINVAVRLPNPPL